MGKSKMKEPGRTRLYGSPHPAFYLLHVLGGLWFLFGVVLAFGAFGFFGPDKRIPELGWRIFYLFVPLAGVFLIMSAVRQCSVLLDEDVLCFGKHKDPPGIAWTAISSVSVSIAEEAGFPVLDIPFFADLRGSANRLCPRIVYRHPRLGQQSLDVPQLGAYLTRTGIRRVERRARLLATRANLKLEPVVPLDQLRAAVKEHDRLVALPPNPSHQPKHMRGRSR